jgi:adenosylcobinamide-GDP ribazoletransferase
MAEYISPDMSAGCIVQAHALKLPINFSRPTVIKTEIKYLLTALMFFTRVPIKFGAADDSHSLNQSLKYFPLIGWLVGGFCACVFYLSLQIWPTSVAVLASMVAGIFFTGALHEDGLADSCDAFGGGWDSQQVLAIMKDANIGAYGAIGLILVLLCKTVLLIELAGISIELIIVSLLIAHSSSRFLVLLLTFKLEYVQDSPKSKSRSMVEQRFSLPKLLYSGCFIIVPLWFMNDMKLLLAIFIGVVVTTGLGYYFKRRIGGYTGDCLGATQQITEIAIYLAILGLCKSV